MNDIKIQTNDLNGYFKEMEEDIHKAKQSALRHAGLVLKNAIKQSFSTSGIKDTGKSGKYSDRLIDAIRQSPVNGADTSVAVSILGVRDSSSGTFRLRFFEGGTKVRKQKTWNGNPLKKKRNLGKISDYGFFASGVNTGWEQAIAAFNETFDKKINDQNG